MDVLEGTVEEWYDQVDGLLKASDFIPGNYEYAINVAYSNPGPFNEGGQTHVDIGCDRFKIISLDNSYISLEMEIPITVPRLEQAAGSTTTRFKKFYVGFKSAFDAIDQYRIYSNTDLIQTQNHANYESYLQYMALSDVAKENSELYATWDKIQNFNEDVPGVYIDISTINATTGPIEITIPLKLRIPLNQFLMFANLKWFPSFFGRLTLEIYPSYKNLVVCPIITSECIESDETEAENVPAAKVQIKQITGFVSDNLATSDVGSNLCGFRQINTPVFAGFNDVTATHVKSPAMAAFTCNTSTTKKCHLRLAETVVRMDVYNQVLSRFINQPMLFPIQTIISKDLSGKMANDVNYKQINQTITNALNHCNSIFIVFKKSHDDRTCFENPMIKWQVNIDGKYFPREQYQTYSDHKNINLFLDATNFNGNGLFSVPNDIYHSLQPFLTSYTYAANGNRTETKTFVPKDRSNFAIGIPFCEDDTFQAGIHSGGTVQVELVGSRTDIFTTMYANSPTGLYVEDCILKLRSVKPSGEAQIAYTHATPEQLLSTAVVAN
ncbi:MAG: hypothetical protein J6R47_03730 [Acholeplasmatales bacterium]|nr:hypothetical protein [Acholeplasmatales bacterium]